MQSRSWADHFTCRGRKLVGVLNRPPGPEGRRFPAVLLLHGYPGAEKNVDVQRELLKRGVASFALHFRGAWGSEGRYGFADLPEQARAGLRFLARQPFVDPRRLAVFGFSMGGWTALHLASMAPVRACAAVAPVGGPEMVSPRTREVIARMGRVLRVPGKRLADDFIATVRRRDPAAAVRRSRCPLLLVHGTDDQVVPFPVSRRIHAAAPGSRLVAAEGATHDFLDRREWLARLTAGWLSDRVRRPASR